MVGFVERSEESKSTFSVAQRAHKLKCLKKARFLRCVGLFTTLFFEMKLFTTIPV
jgi:hypothetical protein